MGATRCLRDGSGEILFHEFAHGIELQADGRDAMVGRGGEAGISPGFGGEQGAGGDTGIYKCSSIHGGHSTPVWVPGRKNWSAKPNREKIVKKESTPPPVFLVKSAQRQENNGDIANCELRRVCKRLKTKGRVLHVFGKFAKECVGHSF